MSADIRTFKDIIMHPGERFLFRKQARRIVSLEDSSPVLSEGSQDEDYDDKVVLTKHGKHMLNVTWDSKMGKKLMLGLFSRSN